MPVPLVAVGVGVPPTGIVVVVVAPVGAVGPVPAIVGDGALVGPSVGQVALLVISKYEGLHYIVRKNRSQTVRFLSIEQKHVVTYQRVKFLPSKQVASVSKIRSMSVSE